MGGRFYEFILFDEPSDVMITATKDALFISHVMGGIQWALDAGTTRAYNASAHVGNLNPAATGTNLASSTAIQTLWVQVSTLGEGVANTFY